VIVIGSGISALTLAGILSRFNKKKVLILEQHSRTGGYSHSFSRKGYTWSAGFHYIGNIFNGKLAGIVLSFITDGKLHWCKTPEPFESFQFPDFTFSVYGEEKKFRNDLIEAFPEEKKAIRSYFRDIKKVSFWFVLYYLSRFLPAFFSRPLELICSVFDKLALMSTEEYLKSKFKSEKLKSIIISQWGNYGLPPSQSAFMIHGLVANHFINGGYYPEGGTDKILESIVPSIIKNGGTILHNTSVTNVIIENGRAIGVATRSQKNKEAPLNNYYAPVIVSSAGAYNTFTKLVPEHLNLPFKNKCLELSRPSVCVALYLGLKDGINSLGFSGANCWIYGTFDHEDSFLNTELLNGKPSFCFLSFTPPDKITGKVNTATIIALTNYDSFKEWGHQISGKRDKCYYELKEKIAAGLIEFVTARYPGFSSMIDYYELGTPLSAEKFTASHEGGMYGLPATPERYRQKWLSVKTPIDGLYLTGTDVCSLGIVSSMMSGFATASYLNGPAGLFKLVRHMRKSVKRQS